MWMEKKEKQGESNMAEHRFNNSHMSLTDKKLTVKPHGPELATGDVVTGTSLGKVKVTKKITKTREHGTEYRVVRVVPDL